MRSKTVYCTVAHKDRVRITLSPFDSDILLQAPTENSTRVVLTPHRARELGKALIQMADEKEKT